jgi:hypothetical protein
MIKYLLGAILTLAIIGNAFDFESDEYSWQIIVNKKEALSSVTNGAIRIYKIGRDLVLDSDESTSLIEES